MSWASEVVNGKTPAAWYRLGEASGTTAADNSGNGRNGAIAATGVSYGAAGLVGDTDKALTFDGAAGELQASGAAALYPAGDYTIVCWFKNWISGDTAIGRDDTGTGGHIILFDNGGTVAARIAGTTITTAVATTALRDGNKHMVCLRRSGTTGTIWIDGVQQGTATVPTTAAVAPWYLGRNGANTTAADFTAGTFDELVIYAAAITNADIAALFSSASAQTLSPTGIASAEAEGSATLTPGPVTVSPAGTASSEAEGAPTISGEATGVSPAATPADYLVPGLELATADPDFIDPTPAEDANDMSLTGIDNLSFDV